MHAPPLLQLSSLVPAKALTVPAEETAPYLRRYLPLAITLKARASRDGTSEMRHVTVMFVALKGVRLSAESDEHVGKAQAQGEIALARVRAEVTRREGEVNKMLVDDKGTVLLCVFGLPPKPHADDALRAVQTAMALSSQMCGGTGGGEQLAAAADSDTEQDPSLRTWVWPPVVSSAEWWGNLSGESSPQWATR